MIVSDDAVVCHVSVNSSEPLACLNISPQLKNRGTLTNGMQYENEYMIILRFKDDKLIEMKEFVDSEYSKRTVPEMMKNPAPGSTVESRTLNVERWLNVEACRLTLLAEEVGDRVE